MLGYHVANNDLLQKKIIEEMKHKETELKETYKNIQKTALENKFYQSVLDDYEKYYNHIVEEKQQQYDALNNISNYLDNLLLESNIAKDKLKTIRDDQSDISNKLSQLRSELEEITNK